MAVNVEKLMLEHVKRFQSTLDRVEAKVGDLTVRVGNLETGQAVIVQHLAHFSAAHATQQLAVDHINDRLDRIERRLELAS